MTSSDGQNTKSSESVLKVTDEVFMAQALELARQGRGSVSPNPLVGAVIVKGGRVIGRGFHREFGAEHAEVVALRDASEDVTGATLYVNLEPCAHEGKQPPCVEAIKQSDIGRVVIGMQDPHPLVNGRGIECLTSNGLAVTCGVLEDECRALNEAFIKLATTGLPFNTLKIAQSLDGRIAAADGQSKWITCEASRRHVHQVRSEVDAVVVGIGTVLADDPSLTVRLTSGRQPKRVVLDSGLRIPTQAKLLNDAFVHQTIVVTTGNASQAATERIKQCGAEVWQTCADSHGRVDLQELSVKLGKAGVASVLIEGGARVFSAYLAAQLVDKVLIFIAPRIFRNGLPAVQESGITSLEGAVGFERVQYERVGTDMLFTGYVKSEGQ